MGRGMAETDGHHIVVGGGFGLCDRFRFAPSRLWIYERQDRSHLRP